jgi:hypothetical protein
MSREKNRPTMSGGFFMVFARQFMAGLSHLTRGFSITP